MSEKVPVISDPGAQPWSFLFLLLMNYLPDCVMAKIRLFADNYGPLRIALKFLLKFLRNSCARTLSPNGCGWNFSWVPSKQSV